MPISECCNVNVVRCEADTSITQVAALMRKHHVGAVVVTESEDGKTLPIGIVTDRDILMGTVAEQLDAEAFTAGDLMSTPVAVVEAGAGFVEALRTMRKHRVRRVPVVDATGALYGIVAADDLMSLMAMELSMMMDVVADQPFHETRLRT